MMKQIAKYGGLVYDYIVVTGLFILALVLLLPFIGVYVGIIGYFEKPLWEREILDIYKTIRDNFKAVLKLTILLLIMFIVSLLNIYYLTKPNGLLETLILSGSWIILVIASIILIFAPIIIIKMKVNLKQIIFNSFAIAMGGLFNYLLLIVLCYLYIYFATKYLLVLVLGVYFVTFAIHYLSLANINILKYKGGNKV
jgi:hypothetical protein